MWRFKILKARIFVSRKQNKEALEVLSEELPPELALTEPAELRKVYQGLAHRNVQHFAEAEKDFDDAEVIARRLAPSFQCQLLIARAGLQSDEQRNTEAEANYKKALAIARREKLSLFEANALADLGRLAIDQEHFDAAIDINESALQLMHTLGMQAQIATLLGNIAWGYFELGDFDSALEFFKESAKASEQSGLLVHSAYWFTGVANTYLALHDYKSAESLSKSTLERARVLDNAWPITECLNTLAEVTLRTGRLDEAERYNKEARDIEEKGLDHFGVQQSRLLSARIEIAKKQFDQAEKELRELMQEASLETPLRWEVHARLAELYNAEGLTMKAQQEYQECVDTIDAAQNNIDRTDLRLSYLAGGIDFYDDYIEFLISHGKSDDALRIAEFSRARTLAEGLSSKPKTDTQQRSTPELQQIAQPRKTVAASKIQPQQLSQRLHATILFYWLGQRHSYLWAITPTKTTYYTLSAGPEIDKLVKLYREAASKSSDMLTQNTDTGEKLYAMLVEPAKKMLPANSRVILLPADSLYGLNFETLIVPEPKPHFWIEDVTLTTGSSLSLLDSAANRKLSREKNLLLLGDAVETKSDFAALPQATNEMQKVAAYFPESRRTILEKEHATPSAYLGSNPEHFGYLHFVTHSTASRMRPLESAVILSKETDNDTYKLYARDIVNHPLQAELVTISACNGAGNRAYSGEGLVGLSWAFLRAGAHNVIGALWDVNDTSTPQLMDDLYRGLSEGKDPATALRDAKLAMLHANSNTVFRKPYYWAPFQLYSGS